MTEKISEEELKKCIWLIEARENRDPAEDPQSGSAVVVNFEKVEMIGDEKKLTLRKYLLTCAHVVKEFHPEFDENDKFVGYLAKGNLKKHICCWPPAPRGYVKWLVENWPEEEKDGIWTAEVIDVLGRPNGNWDVSDCEPSKDWVLLDVKEESFQDFPATEIDEVLNGPYMVIGHAGGTKDLEPGTPNECKVKKGFLEKEVPTKPRVLEFDGKGGHDELGEGMSGGGVFNAEGHLVALYRSRDKLRHWFGSVMAESFMETIEHRRRERAYSRLLKRGVFRHPVQDPPLESDPPRELDPPPKWPWSRIAKWAAIPAILIVCCLPLIYPRLFERHKDLIKPFEGTYNAQVGDTLVQEIMPFNSMVDQDELAISITERPATKEEWWLYDKEQRILSLTPKKEDVGVYTFEFTALYKGFTDHQVLNIAVPPVDFESFTEEWRESHDEKSFHERINRCQWDVHWKSANLEIQEFSDADKTYLVGEGMPQISIYAGQNYLKLANNQEKRAIARLSGRMKAKNKGYLIDASNEEAIDVISDIDIKSVLKFYREKKEAEESDDLDDYLNGITIKLPRWQESWEIHKGVSIDGQYLQLKQQSHDSDNEILNGILFTIEPPSYTKLKELIDIEGMLYFNATTNRITIELKK